MKRKAILFLVFGVLLIGSGLILSFVESFANDIESSKENIKHIEKEYNNFKDLLQSFNGEREIIYTDIFNNLFIENIDSSYDGWVIELQDYEKTTEKILDYKNFLNENCFGIIYGDSSIQSKCDSMLISYETVNNYYVKDINKWNDFVNRYNSTLEDKIYSRELFDLKSRNYIDFNDDGEYLGK